MIQIMLLIMAITIGIISFTVLVDAFGREIAMMFPKRPRRVSKTSYHGPKWAAHENTHAHRKTRR